VPRWVLIAAVVVVAYLLWRRMGKLTSGGTGIPLGAYWPGQRR
jgi:hypothetical protein